MLIPSYSDNPESRLHFLSKKFTDWMKIVELGSNGKILTNSQRGNAENDIHVGCIAGISRTNGMDSFITSGG